MAKHKPDPRTGIYYPVLPLDVLILKLLPKEGSMFMNVYPEGASIKDIQRQVGEGRLSTSMISTRLRVMHLFGYCEAVTIPRAHTAGWQVTPKGEQFIAEQEGGDGS
jgi:DNA-binding HxlR family transcriptional regulator